MKTLIVVVLICGISGMVRAAELDQKQYLRTVRQLLQSGEMDRWRGQMPMHDKNGIMQYLRQFDAWSELAADGRHYQWVETEYVVVAEFKEKLRAVQTEAFPKLRFALADVLTQELKGVTVKAGGNDYKNIRLTNKDFQDMDLVRAIHSGLGALLLELRFTQVEFMLDHEDITANFRLIGVADNVIVLWDADYRQYSIIN